MKRLIASHALAGTAVAMPWPALLATIWHESGDAASLGVAGAARYLPCVLLSAVLGGLGDRFGRFWTVRTVTAVRVLSLCVVAALMATGATWAALVMATLFCKNYPSSSQVRIPLFTTPFISGWNA